MLKKFLFLPAFYYVFIIQAQHPATSTWELFLSGNYSSIEDNNTENRLGYGLSLYKKYTINKSTNLITGIEFNRISFYKKVLIINDESFFTRTTYRLTNLSVPLLVRKHLGYFFLEPGVFLEINLGGNKKGNYFGTLYNYQKSYHPQLYSFFLNTESIPFNYGPQLGLGFKIPYKNKNLNIKGDYKYGLRKETWYSDYFPLRYFRLMAGMEIN